MVADLLKAYHARYPDITELHTPGLSARPSHLGASITDNPKDEMEPTVLMVAAHHGSELLSQNTHLTASTALRGAEGTQEAWIAEWIWVVPRQSGWKRLPVGNRRKSRSKLLGHGWQWSH